MFEKLKLLQDLEIDDEKGEVRVGGKRVFLPATEILNVTRKKLYNIGPPAKRFMYEAGKESGREYARAVKELFGESEDKDNFIKICENFGVVTGWGKLNIVEKNFEKKEFTIELRNSFFTSDRNEKTCEYDAGMLAGAAEIILDEEIDVKEVQCVNEVEENKKCIFKMKPSSEFSSLF